MPLVCPVCGSPYFAVLDKLDYNLEALKCMNCGWDGTTDDLVNGSGIEENGEAGF